MKYSQRNKRHTKWSLNILPRHENIHIYVLIKKESYVCTMFNSNTNFEFNALLGSQKKSSHMNIPVLHRYILEPMQSYSPPESLIWLESWTDTDIHGYGQIYRLTDLHGRTQTSTSIQVSILCAILFLYTTLATFVSADTDKFSDLRTRLDGDIQVLSMQGSSTYSHIYSIQNYFCCDQSES